MGKTVLSIHKEIEKKRYAESPVGKMERELTKIYDSLKLKNQKLPEDIAEQVYNIRDENEKWHLDYIARMNRERSEAIEAKLLESFTKEVELLKKHGY